MTERILIVGQAPAANKQTVPYDTTMLYDILRWAGISKEKAQNLFEFEALTDKFPGFNNQGGHKKPSSTDMELYWESTLKAKVLSHHKIIVLGRVAEDFLNQHAPKQMMRAETIFLLHPSRRNQGKILAHKKEITTLLKQLIWER